MIFCFRTRVGFRSRTNFFCRIALKIFLGAFQQISRLFFCRVFFFIIIKSRTSEVRDFLLSLKSHSVSLAKNFLFRIALKLFLGTFQQISRTFFFVRFLFFHYFYSVALRVLSVDYSSETVQDIRNLKNIIWIPSCLLVVHEILAGNIHVKPNPNPQNGLKFFGFSYTRNAIKALDK